MDSGVIGILLAQPSAFGSGELKMQCKMHWFTLCNVALTTAVACEGTNKNHVLISQLHMCCICVAVLGAVIPALLIKHLLSANFPITPHIVDIKPLKRLPKIIPKSCMLKLSAAYFI